MSGRVLNILSWLWQQEGGRTSYTAGHVNIWAAQIRRHTTIAHQVCCVTDTPLGLDDDIAVIAPPGDFVGFETHRWGKHLPNCFRRLALFRPDAADIFGERFVSMDIDCVIASSIDTLFDRDEDFVMYRGTNPSRPYNGSMLMMTAGCRSQVYERFNGHDARIAADMYLGSDQSWISYVLGRGEATWGPEDGVAWYGSRRNHKLIKVMFFPGYPKPWHLIGRDKWITEHYRGDEGGRCVILGVGDSVWQDFSSVDKYDAVIALPETAFLWQGYPREVVNDEREAELAARMHGFSEIVWCGR
jgi:hypothetical protein